ncbi:hypothetical protein QWA_17605, partial [Alcaligenes faecalis subsp. faecalis NCIB 8687]
MPADAVKDLQPGDITAEVTGKDQYGNEYDADTSRDYDVQTETPVATIEIDQPFVDGVLNIIVTARIGVVRITVLI